MTVSVVTEPALLVPGKKSFVSVYSTAGNWVKVFLTSAPPASEWRTRMEKDDLAEIQLWSTKSGERHSFTFDVAGRYVCTVYEVQKGGVTFGGDHAEDPDGYSSETFLGSSSYSFVVGQRMTGEIRVGNESGLLSLFVWDSTIRKTTVPTHGEITPRIDPNSEKMRVAVESSSVMASLAALDGVAASTAASSLATVADNIITKFNLHRTDTCHSSADSVNSIATVFKGASTADAFRDTISKIGEMTRKHFTNDNGTGAGTASFHTLGDWDNLPALNGAADTLTAGIALASIWHAYEQHRSDTGVHTTTDTANSLTSLPPLLEVWRSVISVLKSDNPTAPNTDNPGATLLIARAGLVKS